MENPELAHWDACGGMDGGLKYATVTCSVTTPEEAVARAMERAQQKYRVTDWGGWRFRLVEFGQRGTRRVLHFRIDERGRPVPFGE